MGRHYTKTLSALILQEIDFFYKEKIKIIFTEQELHIIDVRQQIHFVLPLFLLSIIFSTEGSIKKFITNKDKFIAEKML